MRKRCGSDAEAIRPLTKDLNTKIFPYKTVRSRRARSARSYEHGKVLLDRRKSVLPRSCALRPDGRRADARGGLMVDDDLPRFELVFKRAYLASQVRWRDADFSERVGIYFRRLKRASFEDVATAAARWFDAEKKFPSVAEWLAALPTRAGRVSAVVDARHMTTSEVAEWERARRQLYAGDVCGCLTCLEAGVADQPRRFVPIDNSDGGVLQAWHPERKQLVPVGEWIHGWELARWYAAREACLHAMRRRTPTLRRTVTKLIPFTERVDRLFAVREREPGEEG